MRLNKDKYDSIDIMFQDEARFGLMTHQKRTLTARGVQAKVHYQHSYKYVWLWGSFSPITGHAFYWETPIVNNAIFESYLKELSQQNPREYKILVIDNAGFHACKNIEIPENIYLLNIPPYSPELNPAEKVWQWMKDRIAMKFFESIEDLQNRITETIQLMDAKIIKSITGYELYTKPFIEKIKT
ncbi:IS630 family transposase [Flavivirga aquatica]|uniref:IS630 family transposase n=1 Tax=Flavivirga aquatica TaxID=1849968 RepID=UPI000F4EA5FA|nr:IS630 family transposase [Flavivirga aquatica]